MHIEIFVHVYSCLASLRITSAAYATICKYDNISVSCQGILEPKIREKNGSFMKLTGKITIQGCMLKLTQRLGNTKKPLKYRQLTLQNPGR